MKFDRTITEYLKFNKELHYAVRICKWFHPSEDNPEKPTGFDNRYTWNVYLIVYKDCALYDKFKQVLDDPKCIHNYESWSVKAAYDYMDGVFDFDWHGGATYMDYFGNQESIMIGDDYAHIDDNYECSSHEIPGSVESEASRLYEYTEKLILEGVNNEKEM